MYKSRSKGSRRRGNSRVESRNERKRESARLPNQAAFLRQLPQQTSSMLKMDEGEVRQRELNRFEIKRSSQAPRGSRLMRLILHLALLY